MDAAAEAGGLPVVAVVRDRREVVEATIPREAVVVAGRNRKVGRVPRGTKGDGPLMASRMAPGQATRKAVLRGRATLSRGAATTREDTARRAEVPRPAPRQ